MTQREAGHVVGYLNAVFPREALEPETVAVWVDELSELPSYEYAVMAARETGRSSDRYPTLRAFLDTYRIVRDREDEKRRPAAIEQVSSGPRELPDSVREWLANGPRSL